MVTSVAGKVGVDRISDSAVKLRTRKTWKEWFKILDKAGAKTMTHKEIASFLYYEKKVRSWWCQMIAVTYEQEKGLRELHQAAGGYQSSVSKTFDANIDDLYRAWIDPKTRKQWLRDAPMTIRKATATKSLRIAWDGKQSNLDVRFSAKGEKKSSVTVDQTKMKTRADVSTMKKFWKERFEALATLLEA